MFELVVSRRSGRAARDLYHAALEVRVRGARFVVELAPAWGGGDTDRGVVARGPVGLTWLGRSRFFRYEVRRWRDGVIPDAAEAVGGPRLLTVDSACGWSAGLVVAARQRTGSPEPSELVDLKDG
jgi:hypothetical protein